MGKASKGVTLLVGLFVGALFLWLALRGVELAGVIESLRRANPWSAFPFLVLLALFYWLKALRWTEFLRPTQAIPATRLFRSMIIGFAGNNVLPIRLGELLRVYLASREFGLSKTLVLATLVLERMFDALAILVLFAGAILASNVASDDIDSAWLVLTSIVATVIVSSYLFLKPPGWLSRFKAVTSASLPESVRRAIFEKIEFIRRGLDSLASTRSVAAITGNSIVQWLLLASCIYISLDALDIDVDLSAPLIVLGLVVAGISIPSAPGFIGTIEFCFVIGLGFFDVAPEKALAAAIFYHVLTFVAVTGAGAAALYIGQYRKLVSDFRSDRAAPETLSNR